MKKIISYALPLLLLANSQIYCGEEYFFDHNYTLPNQVDSVIKLSSDINLVTLADQINGFADPELKRLVIDKFFEPYTKYQLRLVEQRMEIVELEHKKRLVQLKLEVDKIDLENEFKERELTVAEYFHNSQTGKDFGRPWFELSDSDKKKFMELYIKHYDREDLKKKDREDLKKKKIP